MWEKIKDKAIWIGLAIVSFFATFLLGKSYSDSEYKKQKLELKELIRKQEKEINRLHKRKDKLRQEIENNLDKVDEKQREIENLQERNEVSKTVIKEKKKELKELKKEYTDIFLKEQETMDTLRTLRENNEKLLEGSENVEKNEYSSIFDIDNAMQSNDDSSSE